MFGTAEAVFASAEAPFGTSEAVFATAEAPFGTSEAVFATAEAPFGTDEAVFTTATALVTAGDAVSIGRDSVTVTRRNDFNAASVATSSRYVRCTTTVRVSTS